MSFLGIDIGSSYLKIWQMNTGGHVISCRNQHHRGAPWQMLAQALDALREGEAALVFSGKSAGKELEPWQAEGLLAEIGYIKDIHPQRSLLVIGAEKIELVHFDDHGRIRSYEKNQACAAGTGSFLDEQLKRLGLDFAGLAAIPFDENAPLVASRCAVFAKTDLIHLQQAGHSREALYNGLCRGLVTSGLKSVFGGRIPDGKGLLLSGGLIANPHIRQAILRHMPLALCVDDPAFMRAQGLCARAREHGRDAYGFLQTLREIQAQSEVSGAGISLGLRKSTFPAGAMARGKDQHGNELWHDIQAGERLRAALGLDIGSTSTKAVLVDERQAIRLDLYTRTAGDPITATRRIFAGIQALSSSLPFSLEITACSTTGSGRQLIGAITGADLIVNEISAHARGAAAVDPKVETIFEIGGQDAKFIRLAGGQVVDVNMNYVCAAGTGSFVEEQASTLGMGLDEIGERVMGVAPLANSDRCTVFMNQEVTRQAAASQPRERIMAGVLMAVFKNYLNRVVGPRPYSHERIVFQGATARNKGLVAALEQVTGAQIVVSPFCHVMGAYGAALLAGERLAQATSFKGLELPEISISETQCRGCENACRITVATREGEKITWGYLCGKEPSARKGRKVLPGMQLYTDALARYTAETPKPRARFVMPALPLNEGFAPFWQAIAQECGLEISYSRPDEAALRQELGRIGAGDFCYPIKVAMAATEIALNEAKNTQVLLPFLIKEAADPDIDPRCLYCPFVTALPGFYQDKVYSPVIDFSRSHLWQARALQKFFRKSGISGIAFRRIHRAVKKGRQALAVMRREVQMLGRTLVENIPAQQKTIVLIGRPYNLYNRIMNLGIPELIESLGYKVIPMDILPDEASNADVTARFPDMYWYQGQRILRTALTVRGKDNFFPVLLSNFSCGPDSFILSYFEEVSQGKPYLILELDEHGSATGYQTRIEAFLDMVAQHGTAALAAPARQPAPSRIRYNIAAIKDKRLWIPQIHPYIPDLFAAILNRHGYEARALGHEAQCDCDLGRSYCRGSECLPAALTIGRFLDNIKDLPEGRGDVLIMPRANGPCRYGQYATLHSQILNRRGLAETFIFSPTSADGYAFFSPEIVRSAWDAICLGDMLYKLRCRTVPYHTIPDLARRRFAQALRDLSGLMQKDRDWAGYIRELVQELQEGVDFTKPRKPLVGIVGEIFVRLNAFSNQGLIEVIENAGGEAWLSPMSEWIFYVSELMLGRDDARDKLKGYIFRRFLERGEHKIASLFAPLLDDLHEPDMETILRTGEAFFPREFEGEAILTAGRAELFARQGASLIVNCAPFGCMPGRLSAYLFQNKPEHFQAPIVNLFFDGTGENTAQVALYLGSILQGEKHAALPGITTRFPLNRPYPSAAQSLYPLARDDFQNPDRNEDLQ